VARSAGLLAPAWFLVRAHRRLNRNPVFPIAVPSLGLTVLFEPSAFNP